MSHNNNNNTFSIPLPSLRSNLHEQKLYFSWYNTLDYRTNTIHISRVQQSILFQWLQCAINILSKKLIIDN